jgi:CheY-like chemotaxis protein
VADGVAAALGLDAPWAAVVTDYSMGDGTGLDLAKALRARGFRAPIVLMTGDPTVVPESADVDALLGKPLDLELLKQALRLTFPAKTG